MAATPEPTATEPAATEPAATVPENSPRYSTRSTEGGVATDGGDNDGDVADSNGGESA